MLSVMKKGLVFLFILVIASILFNANAQENVATSAAEIVEIIDKEDQNYTDGYVEDTTSKEDNSNIFVSIIRTISSVIKSIFQVLLDIISKLISSFSSFKCF